VLAWMEKSVSNHAKARVLNFGENAGPHLENAISKVKIFPNLGKSCSPG
jgi:hypothetical protein